MKNSNFYHRVTTCHHKLNIFTNIYKTVKYSKLSFEISSLLEGKHCPVGEAALCNGKARRLVAFLTLTILKEAVANRRANVAQVDTEGFGHGG
jgi:hypothetical protein